MPLQTLSRFFHLVQFTKCWWIFLFCLELNSKGLYRSSGKEEECNCLVYPSSTKREVRYFPVLFGQRRQRNVHKSAMLVQSCCFAYLNLFIFPFSLPSPRCYFNKLPKVADWTVKTDWQCLKISSAIKSSSYTAEEENSSGLVTLVTLPSAMTGKQLDLSSSALPSSVFSRRREEPELVFPTSGWESSLIRRCPTMPSPSHNTDMGRAWSPTTARLKTYPHGQLISVK